MYLKKYIKSAKWEKYNANTRGLNSPDCVKRSMSLAFDIPYSEMGKMLNQKLKKSHASAWSYPSVYSPLIMELGGTEWRTLGIKNEDGTHLTLNEFADEVADPNRIYLVETGKKLSGHRSESNSTQYQGNHLVCVRDGKVWDSWDSRNEYVIQYSVVYNPEAKMISEGFNLLDLSKTYVEPAVLNEISKYAKKKQWNSNYSECTTTKAADHQIVVQSKIIFDNTEWIDKRRNYVFKIVLPVEPTLSEEEAIEKLISVAKIRAYDRCYAIDGQEKKLQEEKKMEKESGQTFDSRHMFLDKRESKFINTLPGWVKPLLVYVNINEPGRYSDSYGISIKLLPGDTIHKGVKYLSFEAEQSQIIRWMLERYKETYEAPFIDYDPFEEY